ncbi:MAG: heme exporter protein CcmD [Pseudomonadota bacterium]
MDQYAAYVWAAYLVTGLGLAGLVAFSLFHARRWRQKLAATDAGATATADRVTDAVIAPQTNPDRPDRHDGKTSDDRGAQ